MRDFVDASIPPVFVCLCLCVTLQLGELFWCLGCCLQISENASKLQVGDIVRCLAI